ncbi:peptidoglycan-binding protein [Metarhizobium album]|uniref:Peptidoglycan-binding protein n=1 Tax=Metarhizobium album TaxID=2182425 RepID=A0A2U2DTW6_9HYPH|nr:N-acetylmuramidase domain-containing protein [Rhizobium album]PWE56746.1 peptidoglycan-binding protein [Rhizobium album]
MLSPEVARSIDRIAKAHGYDPAALKAVVEVESAGKVFANVKGRDEPLIRYEGHYFYKLVHPMMRDKAVREGLASPKAGGVKNPSNQAARWDLLERAAALDKQAAYESASWGAGQVMGSHWKKLGYSSVVDMVETARSGIEGQVELMVRFIKAFNLSGALLRKDWAGFARGYNGPAYKTNAYDTKMKAAYERYAKGTSPITFNPSAGMLRLGSKGQGVREVQVLLTRAGFPTAVDGDFGTGTDTALRRFQGANSLTADGVAGPETMRKLKEFQASPEEKPGALPVSQVPEVKDAAKSLAPLALVTAARDQIAEMAAYVTGINTETANTVANSMLAVSGAIGTGLAIYAIYGWWKSKRTVEQA